jgi:hypothetical protein
LFGHLFFLIFFNFLRLDKRERDYKNIETRLKKLEIECQDVKSKNDFLTNDNNRKNDDLSVSGFLF